MRTLVQWFAGLISFLGNLFSQAWGFVSLALAWAANQVWALVLVVWVSIRGVVVGAFALLKNQVASIVDSFPDVEGMMETSGLGITDSVGGVFGWENTSSIIGWGAAVMNIDLVLTICGLMIEVTLLALAVHFSIRIYNMVRGSGA